jgi:hypothetical protein
MSRRQRARRAARRLAGLCLHCDSPRYAGRTLCHEHLLDQRVAQAKYVANKRRST